MEYINENIIEKGIDLEDISNFVKNKTGEDFNSLSIDKLKEMLELFNNKDKTKEEVKEEPKSQKKSEEKNEMPIKEEKKENIKEETKEKSKEEIKKEDLKEEPKEKPKEEVKKEESKEEIKKEEPKEEIKKEEQKEVLEEKIKDEKKMESKKDKSKEQKKEESQENQKEKPKEIPKIKEENKKVSKNEQENSKNLQTKNIDNDLYYPESYQFNTNLQQKNNLLKLAQNNIFISINISEPVKEPGGFFSKNTYSYRVQCPELKSDVRRTFMDFEWLRSQLVSRYALRLIPPIMKESISKQIGKIIKNESEEIIVERSIRYLNTFISSILQKKILRTSPILHEFLALKENLFKKYQNKLDSLNYVLETTLYNLTTLKGNIKCSLEKDSIEKANQMKNKFTSLYGIYNKIDSAINNLINDFNNLSLHMKEMSNYFNLLNENLNEYKYNNVETMKNNFIELKNIFDNWSNSYKKKYDFFNIEFKETINYMALELDEMNSLYKNYTQFKSEYEEFNIMINRKKENLFNSQNFDKWDIEPSMKKDINNLKLNKKLAFKYMLYKENNLLKHEKKRICVTIYKMNKQYDKLIQFQSKKIQKINEDIKKL